MWSFIQMGRDRAGYAAFELREGVVVVAMAVAEVALVVAMTNRTLIKRQPWVPDADASKSSQVAPWGRM